MRTMFDLTDDEKRQVLGEVLTDQLQAIFEYVKDIPIIKDRLDDIEGRLENIEGRLDMHEADLLYLRQKLA